MICLAFGHKSRSGKDTAADIFVARGFKLVRFAAPIYKILYAIQDFCSEIDLNVSDKNALVDIHDRIVEEIQKIVLSADLCPLKIRHAVSAIIDTMLQKHEGPGAPGTKVPWMLQAIGQHCRKHIGDSVWVNVAEQTIRDETVDALAKNKRPRIVVPDVRAHNEAAMLRNHDFIMINVNRPIGRPIDRDPNHITETALDDYPYDRIINNTGTLAEFMARIHEMADSIE
jgi:N12 class adenine-specific DNA methylase